MNLRGIRLTACVAVTAAICAGGAATARPAATSSAARTQPAAMRWRVDHGTVRPDRGGIPEAVEAFHRARPGTRQSAAAARALERAGLRHAGFTGPLDDSPPDWTDLVAVGDLDGDGRDDTAQVQYVHNDVATTTIVRARRGFDGKQLWEVRAPGFGFVLGTRVGASGAPGVLLWSTTQQAADAFPAAFGLAEATTLSAYDGHGAQVWTRALPPDVSTFTLVSDLWAAVPFVAGIGNLLPGKADDLAIDLMSLVASPAGFNIVDTVWVLNGADGTLSPVAAPSLDASAGTYAFLVPDLSGDGLDDLVIEAGTSNKVALVAEPATGGAPVWVKNDLPLRWVSWVDPVGDVTGDGRGDLGISVDPSNGTDEDAWQLLVVSGATGTKDRTFPGGFGLSLGDADRDGRADLTLVTVAFDPAFTLTATTYGTGTRVLARHVERGPAIDENGGGWAYAYTSGDVQADGVDELAVVLNSANGRKDVTYRALLDGRTSRVLHRASASPVFRSVDGRGDDLFHLSKPTPKTAVLQALDGATGRSLWATTIHTQAGGSIFDTLLGWANVDGDRCADLVVSVSDSAGAQVLVLRGRDGRPAWGARMTSAGESALSGVTPSRDANAGC